MTEPHSWSWPSEAFMASSVPLVADRNWTSTWAHERVKREDSRDRWARPEWIIHSNCLGFLVGPVEVRLKWIVKCMTRAKALPVPAPTAAQTPKSALLLHPRPPDSVINVFSPEASMMTSKVDTTFGSSQAWVNLINSVDLSEPQSPHQKNRLSNTYFKDCSMIKWDNI